MSQLENSPFRIERIDGIHYLTDYYSALGIERAADENVIKGAFRQKAREYHPDRYEGLAPEMRRKAEFMMRVINRANGVLSDPEKRGRYDILLEDWDGPISQTGEPVIELSRPFYGAETSAAALEHAHQVNQLTQGVIGFSEKRLEIFRKMHEAATDPNTEELLEDELLKKQTQIMSEEDMLRINSGIETCNPATPPLDYVETTERAIDVARVKIAKRTERTMQLLQTGTIFLLEGEERSLNQFPISIGSDTLSQELDAFDARASEILRLALERQRVMDERLSLVKGKYADGQELRHDRVVIQVTMGGKSATVLAFKRYGTNLIPDPELENLDLSLFFEKGSAKRAYENGINTMTVDVKEGLHFFAVLEKALEDHFCGVLVDESEEN